MTIIVLNTTKAERVIVLVLVERAQTLATIVDVKQVPTAAAEVPITATKGEGGQIALDHVANKEESTTDVIEIVTVGNNTVLMMMIQERTVMHDGEGEGLLGNSVPLAVIPNHPCVVLIAGVEHTQIGSGIVINLRWVF